MERDLIVKAPRVAPPGVKSSRCNFQGKWYKVTIQKVAGKDAIPARTVAQ
jgi:hypothetical protein